LRIAVLSQQVRHYTGGRYYCYQLACALGELGHDVTLYVDRPVPFRMDFDAYRQPRIVVKSLWSLSDIPQHDLFIGLPMLGAEAACRLSVRYEVPAVVCILDVLPLMSKYRGDRSPALRENFWAGMLAQIRHADAYVFVLAEHNRRPCAAWCGIPMERVFTVYPAVNDRVIDSLPTTERKYRACFISRLEPHKKFPHVVDAVKPLGIHLDVVTAKAEESLVRRRDMQGYVTFHRGVPDKKKFEIISQSLCLISASIWEGFGMFLIEALACATPVVCYSFPVFHEIVDGSEYERYVYFARHGDRQDLSAQIMKCLKENFAGRFKRDSRFGMNQMMLALAGILSLMVGDD